MLSEADIQETFYNAMLEYALALPSASGPLNDGTIHTLMIQTLTDFCSAAEPVNDSYGFRTVRGALITRETVPPVYAQLFGAIISAGRTPSPALLEAIIRQAIQRPEFQVIITKFKMFYAELNQREPVTPAVTVAAIRDTFYNIMVDEYFSNVDLFRNDVESVEAYLFICLPARSIIAILTHSKGLVGIRLQNGALVTRDNCPQEFRLLADKLLTLKTLFDRLDPSPEILDLMNHTVSMKPDLVIPPQLERLKTPEINAITAIISELSIKISQLDHFKRIIDAVLAFCLEL